MSGLDSWEDDPEVQDENLARQTQQSLNFNAQAHAFQPGAQTFYPGQQYGGQPNQYPQYYQQQPQQYAGQGQGYNQGWGGQQNSYYPQYGGQYQNYQQQQQQQPRQAPIIATRPSGDAAQASVPASTSETKKETPAAPKTKVLSISDTSAPPKAKVLSIGNAGATTQSAKAASTASAGVNLTKEKGAPSTTEATKGTDKKVVEEAKEAKKANTKASPLPSGKSSPTPAEVQAQRKADAVAEEQAEHVDDEVLAEIYGKEHVNIIFIGHVDAGKSTLGGSILVACGMVDSRTLDKYKKEAKAAGRETWYLSWALDLTSEERAKGKTVEVGRGFFETEKRRYSILDAPGHKTFVANMIGGAAQADVGILVISARKGEYETGFEKGGQTREHAILAKTQGLNSLVVVVNKMDDPTVEWSQDRFKECTEKLTSFLRGLGYTKSDLFFMPISAQTSQGIKDRIADGICPWYTGPSLLEYLDSLKTLERKVHAPFVMPVTAKYRDLGTMIEGKIEAGVIKKSESYIMMPNRETISISALYGETEDEIQQARSGEQIRVRVRGIEEEDILPGFVLCSPKRLVHCVSAFEAQIVVLELPSILTAGYNCVLHVHSAIEEVQFESLLHKLQKGTGRKSKKPPAWASKGDSIIARLKITGGAGRVCVERFEDYNQLGRFTLRDQGQTIAIGKITKLITDADS